MCPMKTREQELAALTYERVRAYADAFPNIESPERAQYGAMAHKLPILILTAGLTQALAYVESRGNLPQLTLLKDLALVVTNSDETLYLKQSRNFELQEYVYLTRKTMLALKWFKRFSQSILEFEMNLDLEKGGGNAP